MVSVLSVGTNTYQDQADATTLLGDNIYTSEWLTVASDDKDRALITAFKVLENLVWQGTKTGTPQHPRTGLVNCNGDDVPSGATAPDVLLAHALLAYDYSQDATLAGSSATGAQLKKAKAGSAEVEFFQKQLVRGSTGLTDWERLPTTVKDLLKCYTQSGTAGIAGPTITGTSAPSSFTACDSTLDGPLA